MTQTGHILSMAELVARLRYGGEGYGHHLGLLREAADEIERLRAELEAWEEIAEVHLQDAQSLRAENAALRILANRVEPKVDCSDYIAENAALREDAERYRFSRRMRHMSADEQRRLFDIMQSACPEPQDGNISDAQYDAAIDAARKAPPKPK